MMTEKIFREMTDFMIRGFKFHFSYEKELSGLRIRTSFFNYATQKVWVLDRMISRPSELGLHWEFIKATIASAVVEGKIR